MHWLPLHGPVRDTNPPCSTDPWLAGLPFPCLRPHAGPFYSLSRIPPHHLSSATLSRGPTAEKYFIHSPLFTPKTPGVWLNSLPPGSFSMGLCPQYLPHYPDGISPGSVHALNQDTGSPMKLFGVISNRKKKKESTHNSLRKQGRGLPCGSGS